MARLKAVTDDEVVRLMVRIEDVNASANDMARRLHAAGAKVELPVDRVATCLAACGTLTDLANGILRGSWLDEQRGVIKATLDNRAAETPAMKATG